MSHLHLRAVQVLRAALPWHRPPGQVWRSNLLVVLEIASAKNHTALAYGASVASQRHKIISHNILIRDKLQNRSGWMLKPLEKRWKTSFM
jgi:hypothetical protein